MCLKTLIHLNLLLLGATHLPAASFSEEMAAGDILALVTSAYIKLEGVVVTGTHVREMDMSKFDFSSLLEGVLDNQVAESAEGALVDHAKQAEEANWSDFTFVLSRNGDFKLKSTDRLGALHQAAWSREGETFQLMMNRYSRVDRDRAIQLFGAISSNLVPSLFYGIDPIQFMGIVKWERLEDEELEGIDCFVLRNRNGIGGNHTLWVRKDNFLLVRETIRTPSGAEMNEAMESMNLSSFDESIQKSLESMDEEQVEEFLESTRGSANDSIEAIPMDIPSSTTTVIYRSTEVRNPTAEELEYRLSEGAVLVQDLFSPNE